MSEKASSNRITRPSLYQAVVLGVAADPVPDDSVLLHDRQCAIAKTDANRVDILLAFHLLESQTGMRRIGLEELVRAPSFLLNLGGKIGK